MTLAGKEETQEPEEKKPIKVSFSVPQIVGGALAASTAAAIGSQLGVAGTILGAAVASMVGGIAGTLYSAGIDRTHRKVTEAIQRGYDKVHLDEADATRPLVVDGEDHATVREPGDSATHVLGDLQDSIFRDETDHTRAGQVPVAAAPAPSAGGRQRVWKVMLLTTGAMFLAALAVITVVELGLGRALDGQGGTTVSQVVRPAPSASTKPTPTVTVTATPTPTVTATATATATATSTASETPTASTSPTPSATTQAPTPASSTTGTAKPATGATPVG